MGGASGLLGGIFAREPAAGWGLSSRLGFLQRTNPLIRQTEDPVRLPLSFCKLINWHSGFYF